MPVHIAAEFMGSGKNSEMDALIDMWINTVYNDPQVKGSETAPVVYMRNCTGSPQYRMYVFGQIASFSEDFIFNRQLIHVACLYLVAFEKTVYNKVENIDDFKYTQRGEIDGTVYR